jgi:hypothetical protein
MRNTSRRRVKCVRSACARWQQLVRSLDNMMTSCATVLWHVQRRTLIGSELRLCVTVTAATDTRTYSSVYFHMPLCNRELALRRMHSDSTRSKF